HSPRTSWRWTPTARRRCSPRRANGPAPMATSSINARRPPSRSRRSTRPADASRSNCLSWTVELDWGMASLNSFKSRKTLTVDGQDYAYYHLGALADLKGSTVATLPFSLRVLLENLLRNEDGGFVKLADIEALARWDVRKPVDQEIAFRTARVLLQDFTGVPCVVDLAAMRDAIAKLGGNPGLINPLQPVDLVIDHSVQVDEYGIEAA